jgi:hypothetical protein
MAKELGGGGRVTSNAFVRTMPTVLMLAVTASATRTWYGLRSPLAPGDDDHLSRRGQERAGGEGNGPAARLSPAPAWGGAGRCPS